MYAFRPALTSHISVVHVLVNAIGKKSKSVFLCPKLSLSRICFGPAGTLVGNVKSGALVPTASGIKSILQFELVFQTRIQYKIDTWPVKKFRPQVSMDLHRLF